MRRSLSALASLLALTLQLNAQIPRTISYQGVLCDATGIPKADNTYQMTFRLYETETGGTAIWTETKSLAVKRGLFSTLLGSQVPFGTGVTFKSPYWLGIQIATEAELAPRIALASVGTSLRTSNADTADYAASIKDGIVSTSKILDGGVTGDKVASGQVVKSINSLKDNVTLASGTNVTITQTGNTLRIAASPGSGGTITGVTAGTGLSGGGTSGNVTLNVNVPLALSGSAADPVISGSNTGSGVGVYGHSSTGDAVLGESGSRYGVHGNSISADGVLGFSNTGVGVHGTSLGTEMAGVFGQNDNSDGVLGVSTNGNGVRGQSTTAFAVRGQSNSSIGVYGISTSLYGVRGESNSSIGVYGTSAGLYGVRGSCDSSTGIGVYGTGGRYGVYAYSSTGTALWCQGTFTATSTKSATVKLNDGTMVKLFSEEAAEVYFSDYGEGVLTNGKAHVELDPTFLQTVTVDAGHPMKVFVQVEGDCKGVFVTHKSTTGFDVVELQSGMSNVTFCYRAVCKRRYYEDERLATNDTDRQYTTRTMETVWPEVIARQKAEQEKMKALEDARRAFKQGGVR